MKFRYVFAAGVLCALVLTGPGHAAVISGNWCSVAQIQDFPAGVNETPWWNDLTAPGGFGANSYDSLPNSINGTNTALKYADQSDVPDAVSFTWEAANGTQNTNDDINRSTDTSTGHDQLMAGYLQSGKAQAGPLIEFNGVGMNTAFSGSYDLYLYFDGDGDVEGNGYATFRVWASKADYLSAPGSPLAVYYGRDDGSDFPSATHTGGDPLNDFVQITSTNSTSPTTGNYVVFSGLTADTFYVRVDGQASLQGAGLNGFEVVPEPATMSLLAAGGIGMLLRRRRR